MSLNQNDWPQGRLSSRFSQRTTGDDHESRLYIAFVYGLWFLGQKQAKRGKPRIAENPEITRGIYPRTTWHNSFSDLPDRIPHLNSLQIMSFSPILTRRVRVFGPVPRSDIARSSNSFDSNGA